MKVALVLLLLVALAAVPESDAWGRRLWRRAVRFVRRAVRVYRRVKAVWGDAKSCYNTIKALGKRDADSLDLNKDGHVDVEELGKLLGDRQARDLMEAISGSSAPIPYDDFERSVRDLAEVAEEDLMNEFGDLPDLE